MRIDIERWNGKFRGREPALCPTPDPLLAGVSWLPARGSAIDIACGSGNNAVWLAERGLEVIAVDGSLEGLRLASGLAARRRVGIRPFVADLDTWVPAGRFDLVLVVRYLNRALLRRLPRLVAPHGILAVKVFNRDFLERRPGFNPSYLVDRGELPTLFASLEILDYQESPPESFGQSHIVCRRPSA